MSEIWINDVDLADYGFVLGADPSHNDGPEFSDATAPLLGQVGPSWLGEPVQAAARTLTIAGSVKASSASALRTFLDELKALATNGAARVRFSDRSDQEFRDARITGFKASPSGAVLANVAAAVTIGYALNDPLRYDLNPQGIPLSTARAQLPMGTGPTFPVITIHGNGSSLTDFTATYRNAGGDAEQTMEFTGTLSAGDYLIIDCVKTQVTKSVSGTQSDALSWWDSGDFFKFRHADGYYELTEYPTLELSGTGTPVGLCTYARAWL